MKILLADDDPEVLKALEKELRRQNHDVITVNDGAPAIYQIQTNEFDAVICDFDMFTPGYKVLQEYQNLYPSKLNRFAFHSGSDYSTLLSFGVHVIPKGSSIKNVFDFLDTIE